MTDTSNNNIIFLIIYIVFFVKFMDTLLLKEWVGVWENLLIGSVEVLKPWNHFTGLIAIA